MNDPLINIEAEAALLGAMMIDNVLVDRFCQTLSADDFYEPVHARIYSAIVHHVLLGKRADPITLRGYFENDQAMGVLGGVTYLARLTSDGTGLLASGELRDMVAENALRRRIRSELVLAAQRCADLSRPIPDIVSQADAVLNIQAGEEVSQLTAGECFDQLIAGFSDQSRGVECRMIPSLDRLLGPVLPKQLIICAGRPGMGKTALALSYTLGVAMNGGGVLFVSLEMSGVELAARMAANLCFELESRVQFDAIHSGNLTEVQMKAVRSARDYMHGLPIKIVDTGHLSLGRLNALIRRHKRWMEARGQQLKVVVVDYLQLLTPDLRPRSTYEAVTEVSRALKSMAKDHGVVVFALAQLSREVERRPDKRPQLSDLKDSGQIEQDADGVLFLLRNEYYLTQELCSEQTAVRASIQQALRGVQGEIEFILAKRRNGVTGTEIGRFFGAFQAVR